MRSRPLHWAESSENIDTGGITSACLLRRRFVPDSLCRNEEREEKQVEEICGIPSEIASLMDSFSCQLRREMKLGKINSWYSYAELDRERGWKKIYTLFKDSSLVIFNFLLFGHACIQIPQHLFAISILIRQSGSTKGGSGFICII